MGRFHDELDTTLQLRVPLSSIGVAAYPRRRFGGRGACAIDMLEHVSEVIGCPTSPQVGQRREALSCGLNLWAARRDAVPGHSIPAGPPTLSVRRVLQRHAPGQVLKPALIHEPRRSDTCLKALISRGYTKRHR